MTLVELYDCLCVPIAQRHGVPSSQHTHDTLIKTRAQRSDASLELRLPVQTVPQLGLVRSTHRDRETPEERKQVVVK